MIHSKYRGFVFAFFMALFMSGLMSLIVSLFNIGFSARILHTWPKAWLFSFVVAYPTVLTVTPWVQKLTDLVIHHPDEERS